MLDMKEILLLIILLCMLFMSRVYEKYLITHLYFKQIWLMFLNKVCNRGNVVFKPGGSYCYACYSCHGFMKNISSRIYISSESGLCFLIKFATEATLCSSQGVQMNPLTCQFFFLYIYIIFF